ncbi:FAD-dependent oxidoreductase [Kribbella antibiotica]|uniref:FAD-dependent oxidoreductase n=2 Tax=Kribbella antibiotica TaxID=190195 RepID=A0A4R4ZWL3_9ACTN|nr:FAD-dependent oxidoreductase [Kribbella antibiotica]
MAGLIAGYELLRQGHEPIILEARSRVGGRIHTIRGLAPGLYAEAGAMRIPRVHELTLAYCRHLGLRLRPAVTRNDQTLVYIDGKRFTAREVREDPSLLPYQLARHEEGRGHEEQWDDSIEQVRDLYQREGSCAIEKLTAKYDAFSLRDFLHSNGWSEGAIERYAVMTFTESTLGTGVIQEFREMVGRAYEDLQEITGGMDRLPEALYQRLKQHIHFGTEVRAVSQDDQSVTVHARRAGERLDFSADYAICTLPFSVLRGIDIKLSAGKQRAVRQLHYDAATKIFFQVRTPFWQQTDNIRGGTTVTDLPVRRVIYPSNPAGQDDRAVLLASYTWGQDALQWAALDPDTRVERALQEVSAIHPEIAAEFETGVSYSWYDDPYAMGAYALFEPEQQSTLHADIVRPEGRIHFAGEHCSRWPAWIEGAVESGLHAAATIHQRQSFIPTLA